MLDPLALEETFHALILNLSSKMPDGVIDVNLELLQSLNLLDVKILEEQSFFSAPSDQFYMLEGDEKLTLFNEEFVVWMLPSLVEEQSVTYVMVAKNSSSKPKLELVFLASGVYNTSWLVLGVLDAFLREIKENDMLLRGLV